MMQQTHAPSASSTMAMVTPMMPTPLAPAEMLAGMNLLTQGSAPPLLMTPHGEAGLLRSRKDNRDKRKQRAGWRRGMAHGVW